ncbi:MmgE/PrpD family protein [Aeromicrobium sp. Leaf350]|uniref:MmgE/PrpD family protein n=1 Tax=Aeromicrobium sp. Leaf350 TaxID=2876565 RepID=UPI001E48AF2F|nr:MmgE/PrpD family protein [Aeromicrobium sp. Leaf350]
MTTARRLAHWGTSPLDVPADVDAAAKRHLLDGLGTAIAGHRSGTVDPVLEVAAGLGGPPEAVALGDDRRIGAPAAALATGALVHALDFDDTHAGGLVHATAVVLPAVFAVGQQVGATGRQALDAAVVGYETVCRIAAAAPHGFHTRGLHATMVAGVFSSALVTARLTGQEPGTATDALGIAGSQAGGLLAFLGTGASTKQLHPGLASHAGILAARLAAAGASGPATVLDGPNGLYDALSAVPADPESVVEGLGDRWETTRIGIKPYPACQLMHVTLDAMREVAVRESFGAADVVSIIADVHPDSAPTVCPPGRDLVHPNTPYAAKFSLPWSTAAMLVDGTVGLDTYEPASLDRLEVSDVAARISWNITDPVGHAADAAGRVVVRLKDGRDVVGSVSGSAGTTAHPLTDDQLHQKFLGNAGHGGQAVADLLARLEDEPSLDALVAALHSAIHPVPGPGGPS